LQALAVSLKAYLHGRRLKVPESISLLVLTLSQGGPRYISARPNGYGIESRRTSKKDSWNQAIFFVSKDENLTKAHIRYLEGRLIEGARAAGRSIVVNGQSSGARLPESDREDMEIFLDKIIQLLPVLGVELLVPSSSVLLGSPNSETLICKIKGLTAQGYLIPNGFLVLVGS